MPRKRPELHEYEVEVVKHVLVSVTVYAVDADAAIAKIKAGDWKTVDEYEMDSSIEQIGDAKRV